MEMLNWLTPEDKKVFKELLDLPDPDAHISAGKAERGRNAPRRTRNHAPPTGQVNRPEEVTVPAKAPSSKRLKQEKPCRKIREVDSAERYACTSLPFAR